VSKFQIFSWSPGLLSARQCPDFFFEIVEQWLPVILCRIVFCFSHQFLAPVLRLLFSRSPFRCQCDFPIETFGRCSASVLFMSSFCSSCVSCALPQSV
jgi:hypothetical protein